MFRGTKEYTGKQVQDMLGLAGSAVRPGQPAAAPGQPPQMSMPANRYTLDDVTVIYFFYMTKLWMYLDSCFLSRTVSLC